MELKNLVNILKFGGRFIITDENGNPRAVLMAYDEFEELMVEKIAGKLAEDLKQVEQVNAAITRAQLNDLREEVLREDFISVEPLPEQNEELD